MNIHEVGQINMHNYANEAAIKHRFSGEMVNTKGSKIEGSGFLKEVSG